MISGIAALVLCMAIEVVEPAPPDANDPVYAELLKVRSGLVEAYNRKDIDGVLAFCHPQIVVTWQNGEVTEGREGVKGYYEKMMVGPNKLVDTMTADPKVDNLAIIYGGDTAISRGAMNDHYRLTDGMEFDLNSRWSATLVKEPDGWKIANFHASAGAFDNPLLKQIVGKTAIVSGIAGGGLGLVVGLLVAWLFIRRRSRTKLVG